MHDFFCAHTPEREGLIEMLACLFEAKTYSPGEDTSTSRGCIRQLRTHVRQVRTCVPGEDTQSW